MVASWGSKRSDQTFAAYAMLGESERLKFLALCLPEMGDDEKSFLGLGRPMASKGIMTVEAASNPEPEPEPEPNPNPNPNPHPNSHPHPHTKPHPNLHQVEAAEAAIEAESAAEAAAVKQKAALAALMAGKAAEEAAATSAAQKAASRIAAIRRGQKSRRPAAAAAPRPLFIPKGIPAAWAPLCKVSSAPVLLPAARLLALIAQVFEAKMASDVRHNTGLEPQAKALACTRQACYSHV